MTPAELKSYLDRGYDVLSSGFIKWGLRIGLSAVAVGHIVAFDALAEAVLPPEDINPAQWAQKYRYIAPGSGSPRPGKWDNATTPYLVEPMESLGSDDPCAGVVCKMSAQVGKTEIGINWLGYVADIDHKPMLITQPGIVQLVKFNREKLQPSIDATPRMRESIAPEGDRLGENSTTRFKHFAGGGCHLGSANASADLQSSSRARYWGDEVGEYPAEAGSRGDPVRQAIKRMEAWGALSKYLLTSTCQLKHSCKISEEYERSDQRRFYVPCPHCDDFQILDWENLAWGLSGSGAKVAVYSCGSCGCDIYERDKFDMVAQGVWLPCFPSKDASNPAPPSIVARAALPHWRARDCEGRRVKGYHLWKIYSNLGDWPSILVESEDAEGNPESLKVFWQQTLAEPWDDSGEAPDHEDLAKRVESFPDAQILPGMYFATGAMDVQIDRIEWGTYAWGPNLQGQLVEKGILEGATDQPEVWEKARELWATKAYRYSSGVTIPVDLWGVDSGYRSPYVYQATKGFPNVLNLDGRGSDKPHAPPLGTARTLKHKVGNIVMGQIQKFDVGTYNLKSRLYGMIRQWTEGPNEVGQWPRGIIHFGQNADIEFFAQLTAEVLIPHQRRGGRISYHWEKIKRRANEHHDIAIYNLALACGRLRWDSRTPADWEALIAERGGEPEKEQKSLEDLWGPAPLASVQDKLEAAGVTESKVLPRTASRAAALARLARLNNDGDD
ncbi:phage terminase large subunit GpA-like protein [Litorimonas taeanensis]|uniref:Phage terminase large subunit GpA-like protein n=1 Tax=Litorimonas taeanensis TaxID=568099 RepID=A0A420WD47_9PROT|nr:terminase gpA endonuclease subunit [Litorimonas taeanensis]RKQ68954.1 phage terminase large subunit GpA-like protein [Litorimonas taeanensis]